MSPYAVPLHDVISVSQVPDVRAVIYSFSFCPSAATKFGFFVRFLEVTESGRFSPIF